MRYGRPTKQCLRLGPGRYSGGCGRAAANSNCCANSCVQRYSVHFHNTNAYGKRNSDTYSYGDSDSDTYCYGVGYTYTYSDCDGYTYSDPSNADAHTTERDAYTKPATRHAAASSDSASSAVRKISDPL